MELPSAETIKSIIQVLTLAAPLFAAAWRFHKSENSKDKAARWKFFKDHVPDAHMLAKNIAEGTKTKTDDEFIRRLEELAKAFGYEIEPHEIPALKALGSAEEQGFKLAVALSDPGAAELPGSAEGN